MKTPIFAIEGHSNLQVFRSQQEAESYLEPIDVKNGEYEIYDAEGFKLDLLVEKQRGLLAPEKVKLVQSAERQEGRLIEAIHQYMRQLGQAVDGEPSLADLVNRCATLSRQSN